MICNLFRPGCYGSVVLICVTLTAGAMAQPPLGGQADRQRNDPALEPDRSDRSFFQIPPFGQPERDDPRWDRDRDDRDRDERDRDRDERDRDRDRDERDRDRDERDRDRAGRSRPGTAGFDRRVLPPGPDWRGDRWVLGIYSQSTSTGVRVREVVPGSSASRAGLERDDVIVTVEGYQVGRVGRQSFPLGEELQIRAGRRGEVLLLVQNHRNGQLLNLPVQLERRGRIRYGLPRGGPFTPPGQQPRRQNERAGAGGSRSAAEAPEGDRPDADLLDAEGVE